MKQRVMLFQTARQGLSRVLETAECGKLGLEVCEMLEERHYAFGDDLGFWESDLEKQQAKSMATDLGARVDKRRPLGYREQGLLLTFYRNCPNNSLPILHGVGRSMPRWTPLFPRANV